VAGEQDAGRLVEYGSAADPEGFGWLSAYSPYHQVREGVAYPATLFTVFEADVRAADLHDPGRLVTGLISRELRCEQLPTDTFGSPDPVDVSLAKTADRSVLGCMNDMAFMCEIVTTRSGGLATTDIADLNQALRRNINSARGYQPPIELTAQRLRATR